MLYLLSKNLKRILVIFKMIKIRKPNDFHHHLRENDLLKLTTKECFQKFHHVIVMPNLKVPITTIKQALEYRNDKIGRAHV